MGERHVSSVVRERTQGGQPGSNGGPGSPHSAQTRSPQPSYSPQVGVRMVMSFSMTLLREAAAISARNREVDLCRSRRSLRDPHGTPKLRPRLPGGGPVIVDEPPRSRTVGRITTGTPTHLRLLAHHPESPARLLDVHLTELTLGSGESKRRSVPSATAAARGTTFLTSTKEAFP
jgi:hypothetical protein